MTDDEGEEESEVVSIAEEVWVIDTCSVTEVKRKVQRPRQPAVYRKLTKMVNEGALFFPVHVYDELERARKPNKEDLPFEFAQANKKLATVLGTDYDYLTRVMSAVPGVLDHEKTGGVDEADPYVLALALKLSEHGHLVTVLTEERKDRPDKMSTNTACGLLRLPCVPMVAFLEFQGFWSRPK